MLRFCSTGRAAPWPRKRWAKPGPVGNPSSAFSAEATIERRGKDKARDDDASGG
jgi:hypothetical protein